MMITSKGQVTIPKEFRDLCGLQPHTEVEFVLENGKVVVQPVTQSKSRGAAIVEHLKRFAKSEFQTGLTTEEIMAMTRGED